MPKTELLEGHRVLMRQVRDARPVKTIARSLRPYLRALHSAGYVRLAFDWEAFDTVVALTVEGALRLTVDQESNLSPL